MDSDLPPNADDESQPVQQFTHYVSGSGGPAGAPSANRSPGGQASLGRVAAFATGDGVPAQEQELLDRNEDYQLIARTMSVLQNQLAQAQADLNRLATLRQEALDDPALFVEKLRTRTYDRVPKPQRVVALPAIDWEKYFGGEPAEADSARRDRTRTRTRSHLSEVYPGGLGTPSASPRPSYGAASTPGSEEAFEIERPNDHGGSWRAQNKTPDDRSNTFNVAWTEDEHERLLDLMTVYPSEAVHARRCEKIAAALGSRTSAQVATRIHNMERGRIKSFRTRARPGNPAVSSATIKRAKGGSSRVSGAYYTNPRFAGSRLGPAAASMSDDESGPSRSAAAGLGIVIDPALKATDEYKELVQLQALVNNNTQPAAHAADPVHQGFTCDRCAAEPIVGVRWTCTDCPADEQVDLCDECYGKGFINATHTAQHAMRKVTTPDPVEHIQNGDPYAYLGY
ncbi:ZZ-type zinc finger-containing protein 3 [Geranomyces variabilis]|nr:ZZ-type zinc finger-containing protein 3 [Geranomyces variabilis]